jgi:phage terminase Nu1 subunit (DNA packaging protein)
VSGAPLLLTVAQLAAAAGLSQTATRQRLANLTPYRGEGRVQTFDATEALPQLFNAGDRLDASQERARLDKARADLAELELVTRRGELVPVAEVAATWSARVVRAKGRLLALPARLSPEMVRVSSQRDAERLIRAAILDALRALSQPDAPPPPDGGPPLAGAADSLPGEIAPRGDSMVTQKKTA